MAKYEVDQYKTVDGVTVRKARMCSEREWYTFDAWRPIDNLITDYNSVTCHNNQWYGKVGTETPPPQVKTTDDYRRWLVIAYSYAYSLITLAFPESAYGKRNMGEIDLIAS